MTAETLRRAAALMRERARDAIDSPWDAVQGSRGTWWVERPNTADIAEQVCDGPTAAHIASWHPAVALAVADWLDHEALRLTRGWGALPHALNVAHAYLRETP